MDNFSKTCGAIILLLVLLSACFALQAHAEDYEQSSEAPAETGEVIQVQGVQTYDPQLYDRLDKMQESLDALTAALAPAEDAEQDTNADTSENISPDYTAQLSTISEQLVDLRTVATAETAQEIDPFQKPFEDYTTSETILLIGFVLVLLYACFSLLKAYVL